MGHEKCTDGDGGVRCRASDAAAIWDRLKKGTTNYMFRKLAALVFNYCWHFVWMELPGHSDINLDSASRLATPGENSTASRIPKMLRLPV